MKVEILGVKIDNLPFCEAAKMAEFFLSDKNSHFIVTPNPEMVLRAQKDNYFKNVLNSASLAIPDGVGLVLASKFLDNQIEKKVAGVDFMEEICRIAEKNGRSVFLLGAMDGIAGKARENLKNKFPNLKIVGYLDGDFDLKMCHKNVNTESPDILFVALGAPKQEKWIFENLDKMKSVRLAMGVGGAFDFLSGKIKRAPLWMRKIGLEWMWRLILEPKRAKRILNAVVVFPAIFLYSLLVKTKNW